MVWEWTDRCNEMQHVKRKVKAVDIAITHYTRYVDDQKNYKDDATGIWQRNSMATQLVKLGSYLLAYREDGQTYNKRRLHKGLNCEDLAWLVFIICIIRLHCVISVLCTTIKTDNRGSVIVKFYFFHFVKPSDICFVIFFEIFIKKIVGLNYSSFFQPYILFKITL